MQRHPSLFVANSNLHGRGVFTSEDIPEGSLLEICPVIIIPKKQVKHIDKTKLHDYLFEWGKSRKKGAIVLGFGSIYNHSFKNNATYIIDFEHKTMDFVTTKAIKAGQEICTNYVEGFENTGRLWFEAEE